MTCLGMESTAFRNSTKTGSDPLELLFVLVEYLTLWIVLRQTRTELLIISVGIVPLKGGVLFPYGVQNKYRPVVCDLKSNLLIDATQG